MSVLKQCPFCGGEAHISASSDGYGVQCWNRRCIDMQIEEIPTEAEAIEAWNTRAEPPYDDLLRCLENDWHIRASWDGLRKFWCIELTEEGVRLRDAELNTRAERTCKREKHGTKMDGSPKLRCSLCGYGIGDKRWSYCPSCGAKVVGE